MDSKNFQTIFKLGMWWRFIYGIFKFCLGIFLFYFIHHSFSDVFTRFFISELSEDPNDAFIYLVKLFLDGHDFLISYFISFYFVFWGALDAFLSYNILRFRIWAYPVSLILISGFTFYEIFRFFYTKSLILFFVILFDLFIFWVINKEYRKLEHVE